MHPHYYMLKRMTRKKSQPLFPLRLQASDFLSNPEEGEKILQKQFKLSLTDLKDIDYIAVNEDQMKIPVYRGESSAISFKFVQNP